MSIYHISRDKLRKIEMLFEDWNETLIWSCLQGCMGVAWADSITNPKSAQIVIADFCFLAGKPNIDIVKYKPEKHNSDFIIMVLPPSQPDFCLI